MKSLRMIVSESRVSFRSNSVYPLVTNRESIEDRTVTVHESSPMRFRKNLITSNTSRLSIARCARASLLHPPQARCTSVSEINAGLKLSALAMPLAPSVYAVSRLSRLTSRSRGDLAVHVNESRPGYIETRWSACIFMKAGIELKRAERIGLMKLLSSWKTRRAAVALGPERVGAAAVSLPLYRLFPPRPNCQAFPSTSRLSFSLSARRLTESRPSRAWSTFSLQPRQPRCGRPWNSLLTTINSQTWSKLFDVLFTWSRSASRRTGCDATGLFAVVRDPKRRRALSPSQGKRGRERRKL